MADEVFKDALATALATLKGLTDERDALRERLKELDREIPILTEKINALATLCDDLPPESELAGMVNEVRVLGLTDAVREALKASKLPRTPIEIKNWLVSRGYNLSRYENAMATLHIVLSRLRKQGEVWPVVKNGQKAVIWADYAAVTGKVRR